MAQEESRVEGKDLLVLKRVEPQAGEKYNKEGFVIRVVQWVYDKKKGGVGGSVSLEKRALFLTEDGEVRNGKGKGFDISDLATIQSRWAEIVETVKNPPAPEFSGAAPASSKKASAPEPTTDLEEVPF